MSSAVNLERAREVTISPERLSALIACQIRFHCHCHCHRSIHCLPCWLSAHNPPTSSLSVTATVDSDGSSVDTTPSLRGHAHDNLPGKTDVDSHFRLERKPEQSDESSGSPESPPPFSSHNFPSRYFPAPSPADPYKALVTECATSDSLTALAPADSSDPSGPAPPFEEEERPASANSVVADTKAALPRDTKEGQSSKDLDDGEPPPPYTEGSSPLEGFTYIMAAAGGAASIITQVPQGAPPAPINTALGGRHLTLTPVTTITLTQCRVR